MGLNLPTAAGKFRSWGPTLEGRGPGLEFYTQQHASTSGKGQGIESHVSARRPFSAKTCSTRAGVNREKGGCGGQENPTRRSKGNLLGEGQGRSQGWREQP